ncbi:hypothetical protein B0H16DRAFT_1459292 [Mycena metata]|uniref:Uncharacterized protein n=1 Tax=Mycena metata TaxID=1033252 RepID=A0AAD7J177_9AGAR|nr:hypothetical protein B0H16DRAFT_1459292 [Mycena metata]
MSDTDDEEPKPFPWARIPLEIAHEIVGHNTKDVASLRALALASKGTRFLAVEHLFSVVHFACSEDFPRWLDMLSRTPTLVTLVKRVKFSQPDASWLRRLRGPNASKLDLTTVPPLIPLPNVSSLEWVCVRPSNFRMAAAWMHLFPNVRKVHVENLFFNSIVSLANFLAAFGNLKALSLVNIQSDGDDESSPQEPPQPSTFNLTEVEDLAITGFVPLDLDAVDPILYLLQQSPPTRLKSLDIGGFGYGDPCSVQAIERLLSTSTSSLVNLIIEPTFMQELLNPEIIRMAGRLPVLHALQTLTVWLRHDSTRHHRSNHHSNHQVEQVLKALQAPNLTTIIFRIRLHEDDSDEISELLDKVLNDFLSWDNSLSLKRALTQKFPPIQRLGFHFDVPHSSEVHLRRSCRRKLEKQLRGHLERAGDDVADYLPVEWLDVDDGHSVVVYSKITGKAPWSVPRAHRPWYRREPDTERSDWESDQSLGLGFGSTPRPTSGRIR